MSLRDRQKKGRYDRILAAAARLFVARGFESTRAEEIAAAADLSVGTLYNYFSSKTEILLILVAVENEQLAPLGAAMPRSGPASHQITALLLTYLDPRHTLLNRDLWRLGFALAFRDVASPGARRLRDSDRVLCDQVIELTKDLKAQGLLRSDLDCTAFGTTVFNNANMLFVEFTRSETMTDFDLQNQVRALTGAIVTLALPGGPEA